MEELIGNEPLGSKDRRGGGEKVIEQKDSIPYLAVFHLDFLLLFFSYPSIPTNLTHGEIGNNNEKRGNPYERKQEQCKEKQLEETDEMGGKEEKRIEALVDYRSWDSGKLTWYLSYAEGGRLADITVLTGTTCLIFQV
jgi:hypothetical protein